MAFAWMLSAFDDAARTPSMHEPMETPKHSLVFSQRQNNLITGALTALAVAVFFLFVVYLFRALGGFLSAHSSVLWPPVAAVFLAMILRPLFTWIQVKICKVKWVALCLLVVGVFVPIGLFVYFFGKIITDQAIRLIDGLPHFIDWVQVQVPKIFPTITDFLQKKGWWDWIVSHRPDNWFDVKTVLPMLGKTANGVAGVATTIGSSVYGFTGWLVDRVMQIFVFLIYTGLLLCMPPFRGVNLSKPLVFFDEKTRRNIIYLVDQFLDIVYSFFRGQLLVVMVQAVLFAVGFLLVGLPYGFLLGLILGMMNIVPYLGNIVGLPVIVLLALFSPGGGWGLLAWVVIIFCIVQTLDSYFITPRVMGQRTGLSAFAVIFSLFFWNSVIGGVLGLLLAIPLSAFFATFFRLLKREYFADPETHSPEGETN